MKQKRKWLLSRRALENLLVVTLGILLYVFATHYTQITSQLSFFLGIVQPFIVGFAMAYLLNKPVRFFEEKVYAGLPKWRRGISILTVYLLALLLICALLGIVLPQVAASVAAFVSNASVYVENVTNYIKVLESEFNLNPEVMEPFLLSWADIMTNITKLISVGVPQILNFSMRIGSGFISGITAIIASVYMLNGKTKLVRQCRKLVYAIAPREKAQHFLAVCGRANDIFSGFIVGKLLDSGIIGVICFVGTTLLQIPYAALISVIIGVTNVIPFFGPFIGAIPSLLILLIVDPWAALRMGFFVICLQQFDGNVLGPKILGDSTGISAIWVLVSIIVGGGLFGFVGMLIGVPTFAVLYALIGDFVALRLREKGIDGYGNPLPAKPRGEDD